MEGFSEMRTIAGVFWKDAKATREYRTTGGGYSTDYLLAGILPNADPSTLVIGPGYESVYGGSDMYNDAIVIAKDRKTNRPVFTGNSIEDASATQIATDILQQFSRTPLSGGIGLGPGIWICEDDAPTREETDLNRDRQNLWARHLVVRAEELWIKGKREQVINTDIYRLAAISIGDEGYEWVHSASSQMRMEPCPFCGKNTSAQHPLCQHCNKVINKRLMAEIEERLDALSDKREAVQREAKEFEPPWTVSETAPAAFEPDSLPESLTNIPLEGEVVGLPPELAGVVVGGDAKKK